MSSGIHKAKVVGIIILIIVLGVALNVIAQPRETETTETSISEIPYETEHVDDADLEYGEVRVRVYGENGKERLTYLVKSKNGKQVSRKVVSRETISEPVNQVIATGTKVVWHCSDATSYDRNPYNDNYCEDSLGNWQYVSDSGAASLDPDYYPGKSGAWYYNNK